MSRSHSFESFNGGALPCVLMSMELRVLARNERALALSRKFRVRSTLRPCLPEDAPSLLSLCRKKVEVTVLPLSLPDAPSYSALCIPVCYGTEPCSLLLLFPSARLEHLPPKLSSAVRASHFWGIPESTDTEFAAEFFTHTLRRGFALAFTEDDFPNVFSFKNACDFLADFAKQLPLGNNAPLDLLCTSDCQTLPLYNFPRFTALLCCLVLFCLSYAADERIRAVFFVEQERGGVQISFRHSGLEASITPDSDPFLLFEYCFHSLEYTMTRQFCDDRLVLLTVCCNKAVPAGSIRTDEDETTAERLLEILLERLLRR